MSKILLTGPIDEPSRNILREFGELVFATDNGEATLLKEIDGACALVVRGVPPISAAVIQRSDELRVIARTGVGYSNVDVAAATALGIPVVFTPGAGARAVAEASLAYMLTLTKKIQHWDRQLKAGNWDSRYEQQGGDMEDATVGIVGMGRIGQLVAQMTRPFLMRVIGFDPYVDPRTVSQFGVQMVDIDTLVSESDFICLHCVENDETKGLINRERLSKVKQGSYLINLARGSVVESLDVLHEALQSGRLGGVALDVFEPEPPDVDHPIFQSERCLTAPHSMAGTPTATARLQRMASEGVVAILRGEQPDNVVNREVF